MRDALLFRLILTLLISLCSSYNESFAEGPNPASSAPPKVASAAPSPVVLTSPPKTNLTCSRGDPDCGIYGCITSDNSACDAGGCGAGPIGSCATDGYQYECVVTGAVGTACLGECVPSNASCCGNGSCDPGESPSTCCMDCPCLSGNKCEADGCHKLCSEDKDCSTPSSVCCNGICKVPCSVLAGPCQKCSGACEDPTYKANGSRCDYGGVSRAGYCVTGRCLVNCGPDYPCGSCQKCQTNASGTKTCVSDPAQDLNICSPEGSSCQRTCKGGLCLADENNPECDPSKNPGTFIFGVGDELVPVQSKPCVSDYSCSGADSCCNCERGDDPHICVNPPGIGVCVPQSECKLSNTQRKTEGSSK